MFRVFRRSRKTAGEDLYREKILIYRTHGVIFR